MRTTAACLSSTRFATLLEAGDERVRREAALGVLLTVTKCRCRGFHIILRAQIEPRDIVVLELLSRGADVDRIAATCEMPRKAVHNRVKYLVSRVAAKNRTHIVSAALSLGMIHLEE